MASYMANAALNLAADAVTAQDLSVRLHDGAPGNAGTENRIGTVSATAAATDWTAGASGSSEYTPDLAFGVLNSSGNETVRAYSLWRGNTFLGWGDLGSAVAVAANEAFTISGTTMEVTFARPA